MVMQTRCRGNPVDSAEITARTIFATVEDGDRWSKKMIAAASEKNTELSLFAGWIKEDLLPIDSDKLSRHDSIAKSLHAQWERFKLKEGVIYCRYWEGREEEDTWQLVSPVEYREEIMQTATRL